MTDKIWETYRFDISVDATYDERDRLEAALKVAATMFFTEAIISLRSLTVWRIADDAHFRDERLLRLEKTKR